MLFACVLKQQKCANLAHKCAKLAHQKCAISGDMQIAHLLFPVIRGCVEGQEPMQLAFGSAVGTMGCSPSIIFSDNNYIVVNHAIIEL